MNPPASAPVAFLATLTLSALVALPGTVTASDRALTCKRTCVDLDANCQVTTSDALASLRSNVGLFVAYVSGSTKLLDANRDGTISVRDTLLLLRRVVDPTRELPCEVPLNPTSTTTSST